MEAQKSKIRFSDVILFIIFLALIALPGYLCYEIILQKKNPQTEVQDTNSTTDTDSQSSTQEEVDTTPKPFTYSEFTRELEGQTAYIAVADNIDEKNPPSIILFSHGSDSEVIADMADPDMIDLQEYGKYFTKENYIFAASNEHGANWGSTDSVNDMENLVEWIEARYTTTKKVYLIGHSMGGLPTMRYALKYADSVSKIALLAPTVRTYEWNATNVATIQNIPIHIWHGTSDVNIGISNSREFVAYMTKLGKDIPLTEISGVDHYYVKTECKDQILSFFNEN